MHMNFRQNSKVHFQLLLKKQEKNLACTYMSYVKNLLHDPRPPRVHDLGYSPHDM